MQRLKTMRRMSGIIVLLAPIWMGYTATSQSTAPERTFFVDDFEHGLNRWKLVGERHVRIEPSGDATHGRVLVLEPGGDVLALIRESERWKSVRLEAEVLFPANEDNYLGVVYNFQERAGRKNFGDVYIKGNNSYLQANPTNYFNPGRALYPELQIPLQAGSVIRIGQWQRIRVEIAGRTCHFYVGDVAEPQLTFSEFDLESGALGLKPRVIGGPVWVDNVKVTPITRLSYAGPPQPMKPMRQEPS